ncbi:hypothetical protein [Mesomycoplasma hyorhinis]|uniref:hypothetical protein n=1 Tax=Mesomycoplasma hyorhinis TaxID=2100 RepID=UPI001F468C85|nr:hypothetical protein [Mesomycoplasma hyorhinis]
MTLLESKKSITNDWSTFFLSLEIKPAWFDLRSKLNSAECLETLKDSKFSTWTSLPVAILNKNGSDATDAPKRTPVAAIVVLSFLLEFFMTVFLTYFTFLLMFIKLLLMW